MQFKELSLRGCFEITPISHEDQRGIFTKSYHDNIWRENGLLFSLKEEFFSTSKVGVFRGLHFQLPPSAHNKIVYCVKGEVIDYLLDLRKGSSTYGKSLSVNLSEENGKVLFIPIGVAHGFYTVINESLMVYKTDHVYSPEHDAGVHYSSLGDKLIMSGDKFIVSGRDQGFIHVNDFESPF